MTDEEKRAIEVEKRLIYGVCKGTPKIPANEGLHDLIPIDYENRSWIIACANSGCDKKWDADSETKAFLDREFGTG